MIRLVGGIQSRGKREKNHGSGCGEDQLPLKAGSSCLLPSHSSAPTLLFRRETDPKTHHNSIELTNGSADFKAGFSNIGPILCQLVPARTGDRKSAIQAVEYLSMTRGERLPLEYHN